MAKKGKKMRTVGMNGICSSQTAVLLIAGITLAISGSAAAQLQIPNPLIRPHSITNPAAPSGVPPAPDAAASRTPMPTSSFPGAQLFPGSSALADDSYHRELTELKERFGAFYVSAIVGRSAVLRRSSAARTGSGATAQQPTGSSMAPLPLAGSGAATSATRNDAFILLDGQALEAVGNTGTLIARVAPHQVIVFHVQDKLTVAGSKVSGQQTIVFSGDVESTGVSAPIAIVLERPDPAFKRMISVDTRVRSASAGADATTATPQNQPLPPF